MAAAIQEREQRLIRSERLATVGRMAAQIAHEVRNPLSSIGLNAELLGDELVDRGDEPRKLIASIISEVDRLTEITETYLRFARLPRPKLERESLGDIVTSVVEMARGELAQDGVAVSVDVAAGLPDVAADEAQLRQALINLVRNAREAMSMSHARSRAAASGWRSRCASSRRGTSRCASPIPARASATPTSARSSTRSSRRRERGTGLGLALVHQIVVDHGGRIEVASPPGSGATFTLTFPARPAAPPTGQRLAPAARCAAALPRSPSRS